MLTNPAIAMSSRSARAHSLALLPDRGRNIDPATGRMCAPRGVKQALHAIALDHAGKRDAAVLACIDEASDQAADWTDSRIGKCILIRLLDRHWFQRILAPACHTQFEAVKIIEGGI